MSDALDPESTIVVVGASLAGLRAAEEIRHEGHTGPVVIVGDEIHTPYDRPPLSKQLLSGKWDVSRIHHHTPDRLDELGLDLHLGRRAVALDTDMRTVSCDDGDQLHYDGLVVATGAGARALPGTEGLGPVRTLRTLDDCLGIRSDLEAAGDDATVVVIGAGFIGSEVAATCHGMGATVTVVEALPTPLGRVLGNEMGEACAELHRSNGVTVLTGVGVDRVTDISGGAKAIRVHLADDTHLDCDLVVVGIGVVPSVGWLEGAGLSLDNGLVCDETLFALTGWWPLVTWLDGHIRRPASSCGWSTGPMPPKAVRRRPETCWPGRRAHSPTTPSRSSGPTSTSRRSRSSVFPGLMTRSSWSAARSTRESSSPSTDGVTVSGPSWASASPASSCPTGRCWLREPPSTRR